MQTGSIFKAHSITVDKGEDILPFEHPFNQYTQNNYGSHLLGLANFTGKKKQSHGPQRSIIMITDIYIALQGL